MRRAGYATVSPTMVIDETGLTIGISSQKVEFVALTHVLYLAQDKKSNIYVLTPNMPF